MCGYVWEKKKKNKLKQNLFIPLWLSLLSLIRVPLAYSWKYQNSAQNAQQTFTSMKNLDYAFL